MTELEGKLAKLFLIESVHPHTRRQLARVAVVSDLERGDYIFEAGDDDDRAVYLLEGEASCEYPDGRSKTHDASSMQARYPMGDSKPRRFTARVHTATARTAAFDRHYLEKLIAWDQLGRAKPGAAETAADDKLWVYRLLQFPAFKEMPTANLERLFENFEPVSMRDEQPVMREGDAPDYFYVIREGTATVSKYIDGAPQIVAYLREGDAFGEDALLSNQPRNASVRMASKGVLMRLSRQHFESALKQPMLSWVGLAQAQALVARGAVLIDVRLPEEHDKDPVEGSINIPLYRLREDVPRLVATGATAVVFCSAGERSAAAVFILNKLGFEAHALQGGLTGLQKKHVSAFKP